MAKSTFSADSAPFLHLILLDPVSAAPICGMRPGSAARNIPMRSVSFVI